MDLITMLTMPSGSTDRELLDTMADRTRRALIETVRGLSETQARRRLVPSMTTPIGLLKHAAMAERLWFQHILARLPESTCDGPITPGDPSFLVGDNETLEDVIAEFERASDRARTIAAGMDLADTRQHPVLGTVSLHWVQLLLIVDFARHAGHADILREQLDAART